MANIKISDLDPLAEGDIDPATDLLPIVDTSGGATKESTVQAIVNSAFKSPGAIGATAPAAGTFTTISCTALTSSSGVIGYSTGAGGTVTQGTSVSTGVTINKVCGSIVTFDHTTPNIPAFTSIIFTVTNNKVSAGDAVVLSLISVAVVTKVFYTVENVVDGAFDIRVNVMSDSPAPSVTIGFAVLNNATS